MNYLGKATIRRALPYMDYKKVSLVARGKRKSRQTKQGFLQVYLSGKSLDSMATKNQTWKERRAAFIARHIKQTRRLWDRNGQPTRHHLALVAWAYSPDAKKFAAWSRSQPNPRSVKDYLG